MNKIQQYKQILEQAPEGATHWSEFENVYYKRKCEEWMYAIKGNQCFTFLHSEGDYLEDDAQLLSDLQAIVDQAETIERLKDGLNKEVLEFVRCGIGSNYGGKFYEDKINSVYEPLKTLLKELNND